MKKYFMTVATVALFAIGFAASDGEENSSNVGSATQTEQKQETEKERQAREEQERIAREQQEAESKANKVKALEEEGYKAGYNRGFGTGPASYQTDNPKRQARQLYSINYDAPMTDDEKALCEKYIESYVKGYEEGYAAQQ